MIDRVRKTPGVVLSAMAVLALVLTGSDALACATCFGDPDSNMSKGVVWGVVVLAGIVGFVLAGVAGVGVFWMQRSRRLNQPDTSSSDVV